MINYYDQKKLLDFNPSATSIYSTPRLNLR